jgi:hypothetical protein
MTAKNAKKPFFLAIALVILLGFSPVAAEDTPAEKEKPKHSPTGALLRSAAFPGWGQLYNKKYIKAAIIGVGESVLIYQTAWYWNKTSTYKDLYINAEAGTEARRDYFYQFDRYRDLRNQYIWFLGLTVFYSMFDAYVDAHLKNFDIDLTPDFDPERENLTLWLKVGFKY